VCVAYPGQVLAIAGEFALVETDHRTQRASMMLVPETTVGDWVVVAAGAVLRILDPDDAMEIRTLLDEAAESTDAATSAGGLTGR